MRLAPCLCSADLPSPLASILCASSARFLPPAPAGCLFLLSWIHLSIASGESPARACASLYLAGMMSLRERGSSKDWEEEEALGVVATGRFLDGGASDDDDGVFPGVVRELVAVGAPVAPPPC